MTLHCGLMPETDQADSIIRCRACGSRDVWYSRPRPADRFLGFLWRFKAFRCRACQHRFRVGLSANETSGDAGRDQLRHAKARNSRPRVLRAVLAPLYHPRLLVVRDLLPAVLAAVCCLLRLALRPHQPAATGATTEDKHLEVIAHRARYRSEE